MPLPDAYTGIPPVILQEKEPAVPEVSGLFTSSCENFTSAMQDQYMWLDHAKEVYDAGDVESEQDMKVSWSAYHASSMVTNTDSPVDITALLQLFQEEAKSPSMIKHALNVVKQAVEFLNPNQVPVVACDQPLYATAKLVQWNYPKTHGEEKFLIMFGGLHVEMAALKTLGDWLQDSGWTAAIANANIASPGTAESFLKATHLSRTRHAHQVTACSLHILMMKAYAYYADGIESSEETLAFEAWKAARISVSPQFQYWAITLDFELTVLTFIQALRQGNFQLYRDALTKLIPWFFALDHTHYSRWLPVHLRDMMQLPSIHPELAKEFEAGNFVVHKTQRLFSGMATDQAHEQNNKLVKGDGGAIGLTENSSELLRWMVSGPEIARIISEFEACRDFIKHGPSSPASSLHHEQVKSIQSTFQRQITALCDVVEEMGNPFMEESGDLLVLDSRDIVDLKVVETIRNIQKVGQDNFNSFIKDRLENRTTSLFHPITRNKFPLFSCPPKKSLCKDKDQIVSLKKTCALFSQLYVACQVRGGNMDDFFRHENQECPPSLSQCGQLRSGKKSDLMHCLEKLTPVHENTPNVSALLLDGAVIVNMLKPGASRTFQAYGEDVFLKYIKTQLQTANRIDIVWDEYLPDSLKATTRDKRGKGIRRRVNPNNRLPGNWDAFLKVDENKAELFKYLAELSVTVQCGHKELLSTYGKQVLCNTDRNTDGISPCTHEEADTRLLLHAADCAKLGHTAVMLRTVDTDVVVIAVAMFQHLTLQELWIAFGMGKYFRYIAVHEIMQVLGPEKSRALPAFHAFTGCDQTSSFAGRGKATAWGTWNLYNDATLAFAALSSVPTNKTIEDNMPVIERFVVLMYDRAINILTVDAARKDLFTRKGRAMDAIPPTFAALLQHTKRVAYQAGYCWGQALIRNTGFAFSSRVGLDKTRK